MSVRKAKKNAKKGLARRIEYACLCFGTDTICGWSGFLEKLTNDYKKRWSKKYARL